MSGQLTTEFVVSAMAGRGYEVVRGASLPVAGGAADSRQVRPGDLFTAFHGEHHDGNDFVAEALSNGAVAAICERAPAGDWPDKTIVVAPDAQKAVAELAHAWRTRCNPRVVGITGTVGKTTAKDLTAEALSAHFRTHKSEGNLNSREGLPLALMSLRTDHEVSVLEMGMDSPGEIVELCEIAEPEIGVVLSVGLTHVSKLGSIDAIAREKLSLPRHLPVHGTAILNLDDPRIAPVASELRCHVLTFGVGSEAAIRRGPVTDLGLAGTTFDVTFEGRTETVRSPLPGEHVVPAALAAIGTCLALGLRLDDATRSIARAQSESRMRVLTSDTGATILDDRYNSSPASLAGALRMLGKLKGRRIAIVGRMAELGHFEESEHRQAGRVAAKNCDALLAVGEPARVLVEEARASGLEDAHWFEDKIEAARAARTMLRAGDYVLVKASRSQEFETIIPLLEGSR